MKQIKTAEEILQHHYVHDRGLNNPEYAINAMRAYAEQFIDAAAKEASYFQSPNSMKKKILKPKEQLK